MYNLCRKLAISCLVFSASLSASPWIDANQLFLRHHIQQLSDAGLISAPVTTYPLMWNAINSDLLQINPRSLSPRLTESYAQVTHYLRQAQSNKYNHQAKLSLSNRAQRFHGFGEVTRQSAQLQLSTEYLGDFWAVKLSSQLRDKPQDNKEFTFDNSYLAATFGNWVLRAGALSQWWGPGWDSSLVLGNNARPLPTLSLSRQTSTAFTNDWLNWAGPWTLTSQITRLEDDSNSEDGLSWISRATFRPASSLELGVSWFQLWPDKQQKSNSNQLLGLDFRWSNTQWKTPFSIYAQALDSNTSDTAYLMGIDRHLSWGPQSVRLFLEYTDNSANCHSSPGLSCAAKEEDIERSYNYQGSTLGTYDNAKVWTLGALGQLDNGYQWQAKLRVAKLAENHNDSTAYAANSTVNSNQPNQTTEDLIQLELQYKLPMYRGLLSLGGDISHSSYNNKASDDTVNWHCSWEYRY